MCHATASRHPADVSQNALPRIAASFLLQKPPFSIHILLCDMPLFSIVTALHHFPLSWHTAECHHLRRASLLSFSPSSPSHNAGGVVLCNMPLTSIFLNALPMDLLDAVPLKLTRGTAYHYTFTHKGDSIKAQFQPLNFSHTFCWCGTLTS